MDKIRYPFHPLRSLSDLLFSAEARKGSCVGFEAEDSPYEYVSRERKSDLYGLPLLRTFYA